MNKEKILKGLNRVDKIASASKFFRLLMNPYKYFNAIFFREYIYSKTKKEKEVKCKTFFGTNMSLSLPSGTDIYLTGGKSHDSEIRLAKFLINNLNKDDVFIDVGAHYGYFSLLAAKLVGDSGKVFSFEASKETFKTLSENKQNIANLYILNAAVADTSSPMTFYEFPNMYSEYNSFNIDQFMEEKWFDSNQPKKVVIESIVLDEYLKQQNIEPKIIKIDVEGAEFKVMTGLAIHLKKYSPIIAMEYLSEKRGNQEHRKAEILLKSLDYNPHTIDQNGELIKINSLNEHFIINNIDSDNIVFSKN